MKLKLNNGEIIEINSNVYNKNKLINIGAGIKLKPVGFIPAKYKNISSKDIIKPDLKYDSNTNLQLLGTKRWLFERATITNGSSKSEFFEIVEGPDNMLGKVVMVYDDKFGLVLYIVNIFE